MKHTIISGVHQSNAFDRKGFSTPRFYTIYVFILLMSALSNAKAQATFSYEDFKSLVLKNHPTVKQANLYLADADAEIMQARGAFDPKLSSDFDRKAFKGDDYYNRWHNALKIPTWTGVDFKVGYDQSSGKKLLAEESSRLIVAGLSVPIGQGLVIDARRNTLKQANLAKNIAEAERQKLINKTILYAAKSYWEWWFSHQQLQFVREGYDLANQRFIATRERSRVGEQATIDSVEAKITLQDREVALEQAQVDLQNTRLALSNYLWDDKENPLELPENAFPPASAVIKVDETTLQGLISQAKSRHPEIQKYDLKIQQLGIEEKFRREMLKPTLNANFNFIADSFSSNPAYSYENSFSTNNHKLGFEFVMPLFLRKERGKLQQIRIKQLSTGFELNLARREIMNDVYAAYNEVKNYERQLRIQQDAAKNQELLTKAEQRKFEIGESTLFLINSRESKLIDMRIKVESLKSKYEKALANLAYTAGLPDLL
ncbi:MULTISPECIES: TolC family protein [unclassified Arcicella]|uniref:TolC family protein n=1 Tax=unclassified Arcicella TaxID=2644986 RepID=UPI002858B7EA|nr:MULTISPECIES: TolC family protein [unclassified Arcicella]MDR6562762.1 outer membrane protein TolC [Arcicella sp. BE51]MDR6812893.1 outer membrane protein TolC [Arcicella sp. BE140]MDR6824207.1 outer membrane protein TolC [Arcicella sp. BE139]